MVAKTPAASSTGSSAAPSIKVTSSATPAIATPSTFSAASAVIRTALSSDPTLTSSRSGTPRRESNGSAPMAAAPSAPRRTESERVANERSFGDLVVGPNVGSNARATASAAADASSSDTEVSSLDVSDLASSISQATLESDGSYTINVAMHPSDLGHVQAVISLSGADLHVTITPQTPTGHAALANAVESLKSELSRSGLNVNVSLRDPESRSGRGNADVPRSRPTEADLPVAESEAPLRERITQREPDPPDPLKENRR